MGGDASGLSLASILEKFSYLLCPLPPLTVPPCVFLQIILSYVARGFCGRVFCVTCFLWLGVYVCFCDFVVCSLRSRSDSFDDEARPAWIRGYFEFASIRSCCVGLRILQRITVLGMEAGGGRGLCTIARLMRQCACVQYISGHYFRDAHPL